MKKIFYILDISLELGIVLNIAGCTSSQKCYPETKNCCDKEEDCCNKDLQKANSLGKGCCG